MSSLSAQLSAEALHSVMTSDGASLLETLYLVYQKLFAIAVSANASVSIDKQNSSQVKRQHI